MRIGFNTNYYNTFTKNASYRELATTATKEERDEFVIQDKNKTIKSCKGPITKNTVNKFVQFYYGLSDDFSRDMIYYCLTDDKERYGAIIDRIDKIEGKDENTKEKKSLTQKFLDLMMLPEFFDWEARDEAEELAKLPAFDNGKNKDVRNLLIELADSTEDGVETEESEYFMQEEPECLIEEQEPIFINNKTKEKEIKPVKINFLKKMAAFFATVR